MSDFMSQDIKIKTMNDYEKDITKFRNYLVELGEAARVRNYLLDPKGDGADRIHCQAVELAHYAKKLSEDDNMSPSAFDAQFYAIRRFMLNNLRDVTVFDMESVVVARRVARGIITRSRKRVIDIMEPAERNAYDAKYGMKVPFTEEMMAAHRIKYFTNENASVEDKMAYVATALGYHIGNRPSEASSSGPLETNKHGETDADHRYMVEDIQYQVANGSFVTGPDINEENKNGIQYISIMVDSHKGETIREQSKRGATKRGANAVRRDNGGMEHQLFNDLVEWPSIGKLGHGDIFFSRNAKGRNLKLTTKAMVSRMKTTASDQGINPTLISGKSLRKSLGTDMTRSHVPPQTINAIGRWAVNSNTCANVYAAATAGNVTGTMSEGILRTSNLDISRLNRDRTRMAKEYGRG